MPAFNGRKSGEGDPRRVQEMMPYAEQQSFIHAEMLKSAGLTSGSRVVPFAGGWVRSIILGDFRHIHVAVGVPEPVEQAVVRPLEYYSGLVFGGNLSVKSELQQILEYGETPTDGKVKTVAKL